MKKERISSYSHAHNKYDWNEIWEWKHVFSHVFHMLLNKRTNTHTQSTSISYIQYYNSIYSTVDSILSRSSVFFFFHLLVFFSKLLIFLEIRDPECIISDMSDLPAHTKFKPFYVNNVHSFFFPFSIFFSISENHVRAFLTT